ncbi:MAG: hypothetical protein ACRDJ9_25160 [Dehalococcoidia bacterium]
MASSDASRAQRFDRYVAALLAERSPDPRLLASQLEARMALVALQLVQSSAPAARPDPAFVAQLRRQLAALGHRRT